MAVADAQFRSAISSRRSLVQNSGKRKRYQSRTAQASGVGSSNDTCTPPFLTISGGFPKPPAFQISGHGYLQITIRSTENRTPRSMPSSPPFLNTVNADEWNGSTCGLHKYREFHRPLSGSGSVGPKQMFSKSSSLVQDFNSNANQQVGFSWIRLLQGP